MTILKLDDLDLCLAVLGYERSLAVRFSRIGEFGTAARRRVVAPFLGQDGVEGW